MYLMTLMNRMKIRTLHVLERGRPSMLLKILGGMSRNMQQMITREGHKTTVRNPMVFTIIHQIIIMGPIWP